MQRWSGNFEEKDLAVVQIQTTTSEKIIFLGNVKKFFQRQFSLWKSCAGCTITVQQQPAVSEKKLERNCKKPLLQMSKTSLWVILSGFLSVLRESLICNLSGKRSTFFLQFLNSTLLESNLIYYMKKQGTWLGDAQAWEISSKSNNCSTLKEPWSFGTPMEAAVVVGSNHHPQLLSFPKRYNIIAVRVRVFLKREIWPFLALWNSTLKCWNSFSKTPKLPCP